MSRGPENTFRASVHKFFSADDLYHEKMSNPYRGGGADDWYSGKGKRSKDLWIEWKFIEVPKRDDTLIDLMRRPSPKTDPILSELQQLWLRERYEEGRNVWVGVGSKQGGVIFTDLAWQEPFTAGEFRRRLASRTQLASFIVSFVKGA